MFTGEFVSLYDLAKNSFPDFAFTHGIMKDLTNGESMSRHRKEGYYNMASTIKYLKLLDGNAVVILNHAKKGIYYIYTDETGWLRFDKCTFWIFQLFNNFITDSIGNSAAGQMMTMYDFLSENDVDLSETKNVLISYTDPLVFLYSRYLLDVYLPVEGLKCVFIRVPQRSTEAFRLVKLALDPSENELKKLSDLERVEGEIDNTNGIIQATPCPDD